MNSFDLTSQYKRDVKKQSPSLFSSPEWLEVMTCLTNNIPMSEARKDHALNGKWQDFRECHIKPDLLLVYKKLANGVIQLARLDSHSAIFG